MISGSFLFQNILDLFVYFQFKIFNHDQFN